MVELLNICLKLFYYHNIRILNNVPNHKLIEYQLVKKKSPGPHRTVMQQKAYGYDTSLSTKSEVLSPEVKQQTKDFGLKI